MVGQASSKSIWRPSRPLRRAASSWVGFYPKGLDLSPYSISSVCTRDGTSPARSGWAGFFRFFLGLPAFSLTEPVMKKPVKGDSPNKHPGNYRSLIDYLQATGLLHEIPRIKLRQARTLYVIRQLDAKAIARFLKVPLSEVERWIVSFAWTEERDRLLFAKFRRVREMQAAAGQSLDERHNRIFGTLESIAEQLLQRHMDGDIELTPQDLKSITSVVKDASAGRRLAHNKESSSTKKVLEIQAPEVFKQVGAAVMGLLNGSSPRAYRDAEVEKKSLLLEAKDAEFELVEEGDDDEA